MKFVPHDYQRYCEEKIIKTPNIALFLDMGLGKTVITLTAIYKLSIIGSLCGARWWWRRRR